MFNSIYTLTGAAKPTMQFPITLNNIDITNPVDGNKVFSIDVSYWIPYTDIPGGGNPLTNQNDVLFAGGSHIDLNNQPL